MNHGATNVVHDFLFFVESLYPFMRTDEVSPYLAYRSLSRIKCTDSPHWEEFE